MSRRQAPFTFAAVEPAMGEEVPGFARLLGGEGLSVRRVQPFPEQLEAARGAVGIAQAPPPFPKANTVAAERSEFAKQHAQVLQRAVDVGRGVLVTPKQPSQQEFAKASMVVAQRMRFGGGASGAFVFEHIAERCSSALLLVNADFLLVFVLQTERWTRTVGIHVTIAQAC